MLIKHYGILIHVIIIFLVLFILFFPRYCLLLIIICNSCHFISCLSQPIILVHVTHTFYVVIYCIVIRYMLLYYFFLKTHYKQQPLGLTLCHKHVILLFIFPFVIFFSLLNTFFSLKSTLDQSSPSLFVFQSFVGKPIFWGEAYNVYAHQCIYVRHLTVHIFPIKGLQTREKIHFVFYFLSLLFSFQIKHLNLTRYFHLYLFHPRLGLNPNKEILPYYTYLVLKRFVKNAKNSAQSNFILLQGLNDYIGGPKFIYQGSKIMLACI